MQLVRTLAAALVVGYLFDRLGVPAGALIGAMAGVAVLNLAGWETAPAGGTLRFVAFVVLGWELGAQVTRQTLAAVREAALPILVVVAGLLLASGMLALLLRRAGLDTITSFLAASPGGLSQMVALTAEFGANAVVVSVVHLIRIITVVLTAPLVVRYLSS